LLPRQDVYDATTGAVADQSPAVSVTAVAALSYIGELGDDDPRRPTSSPSEASLPDLTGSLPTGAQTKQRRPVTGIQLLLTGITNLRIIRPRRSR